MALAAEDELRYLDLGMTNDGGADQLMKVSESLCFYFFILSEKRGASERRPLGLEASKWPSHRRTIRDIARAAGTRSCCGCPLAHSRLINGASVHVQMLRCPNGHDDCFRAHSGACLFYRSGVCNHGAVVFRWHSVRAMVPPLPRAVDASCGNCPVCTAVGRARDPWSSDSARLPVLPGLHACPHARPRAGHCTDMCTRHAHDWSLQVYRYAHVHVLMRAPRSSTRTHARAHARTHTSRNTSAHMFTHLSKGMLTHASTRPTPYSPPSGW